MCFSATASFGMAAVLGVMGVAAVRAARHKSYYALAMIPLLFALQQAAEGMVWITQGMQLWWVYGYLFFAVLLWPTWIPFSLLLIERNKQRSALLLACCIVGILSFCGYGIELWDHGATATVGEYISYQFTVPAHLPAWAGLVGYLLLVVGSCWISSNRYINGFGVLVLVAAALSYEIWLLWFTSVWCFFAAVLSCGIYYVVKKAD